MSDQRKACTRCLSRLPVSDFCRDAQKKDGLSSHCRDCRRSHREANRERLAREKALYRAANREVLRARSVADRRKHLAARRAGDAAYAKANPHRGWAAKYRLKCRKYGFTPRVEEFTKADVIATYGDGCYYCPDGAFEHLDHHTAICLRGSHTLGNVRPACARCNHAKAMDERRPRSWRI